MNRRAMLQSSLAWLAAAGAKASPAQSPEGLIRIPAGEFVMGSPNAESSAGRGGPGRGSGNDTRHNVRLTGFHIAKNLVTNAEYKLFCDAAGARYRPSGNHRTGYASYWNDPQFDHQVKSTHPVLFVSYNQAMAYCQWLSANTGWNVTLPSEAQWERAARGPTKTGEEYEYPWGNQTSPDDYKDHLNFNVLCAIKNGVSRNDYPFWPFIVENRPDSKMARNFKGVVYGEEDERTPDIRESSDEVKAVWTTIMRKGGYTTPVGTYPAGPAGCFDMAGNAFEWTRDFSTVSSYLRLAEKTVDPCIDDPASLTAEDRKSGSDGAEGRPTKIIRGGSWYANEGSCKTHRRTETRAVSGGYHSVGFRVAAIPKSHS